MKSMEPGRGQMQKYFLRGQNPFPRFIKPRARIIIRALGFINGAYGFIIPSLDLLSRRHGFINNV